ACRLFENAPSDFTVASILSFPNFCMSSIFLTMSHLPAASPIVEHPVSSPSGWIDVNILHCTKKSRGFFAMQYQAGLRHLMVLQAASPRLVGCRGGSKAIRA